jgi:alkylhydroperoxidase family enzyme
MRPLVEALQAAGRDISELEIVGGIRGDLPPGDGVADLDRAADAIPQQLEAGYTTICFKPSQFTDDPAQLTAAEMDRRARAFDFTFGVAEADPSQAFRLAKRQRAMLDFAVKLTTTPWEVEEKDRKRLRRAGFNDRDIWDIASVAAFYNMTNRLASATDMRPNSIYHGQAR